MVVRTRTVVRRAVALLGATAVALGGGLAFAAGTAQAQPGPAPIDVATGTFPGTLPAGCPDGAAAFTGLTFSANGSSAGSLAGLSFAAGDTVTMKWSALDPDCADVDVSLAAYESSTSGFDQMVDQPLYDGWDTCGPSSSPCTASGLSIVLPSVPGPCSFQLDAVLGLPITIVGQPPEGSFYSESLRHDGGPNLLVSAVNFGLEDCEVAPTTTSTPSATTTPPTTESTVAPNQVSVPTQRGALPAQVTAPAPTPAPTQPQVQPVSVATLPVTGATSATTAQLGLVLAALGMATMGIAGLWGRRPAQG